MTHCVFIYVTILLLLPYLAGVFYILFTLKKEANFKIEASTPQQRISVLVPFRNEEKALPFLIESLKSQQYLHSLSEFILINDHSTDNGLKLATQLTQNDARFRILSLPINIIGKKGAIEYALSTTNGELLIQTDADCTMGINWLPQIVAFQEQTKADLIIAPVVIKSDRSFFSKLQSIEFASLSSVVAGSALANRALLINAANMAYRKEAVATFDNPFCRAKASGDDQFLLQNMQEQKLNIGYLKSTEAIVYTNPTETLKEFIQQRVRWASKSKAYKSPFLKFVAILIFLLNAWIAFLFIAGFFIYPFFGLFILALGLKTMADYPLLYYFQHWSKAIFSTALFAATQLLYSFYTTFTSLWAITHSVQWKQRKVY